MAMKRATPIDIIEAFFELRLDKSGIKRLTRMEDADKWVDFALHYLQTMEKHFVAEFLDVKQGADPAVRLYFEPRLREEWDAASTRLGQSSSPLLGVSPDPDGDSIDANAAAQILGPLKKHLLIADSVYIRDSFYYCFDLIEACVDTKGWRDDPNLSAQVRFGIRRLKAWLPLLKELRPLIDAAALVFMPYYMTPSWPYDLGYSQPVKKALASLRIQPPANRAQPPEPLFNVNVREIQGAWLNARLMGLDPVLPNPTMFDIAADLYLPSDDAPVDLTCDLTSLDIVPLGAKKPISIKTLVGLRRDEHGFDAVRKAVVECQGQLQKSLRTDADRAVAIAACKSLFEDQIAGYEGRVGKVLRYVERPLPSTAFTGAVGVALIPAGILNPWLGVAGAVALTPAVARLIQRRINPKIRAMKTLTALL
jgi:hypothetical protein